MARRKFGRQDIIGSIANAMGKRSKPSGRGSAAARQTGRAKEGTSRPDIGKSFARKGGKGTQRGYGNMPEDVKSKVKTAPRAAPPPWQESYDGKPKSPQDYEKAYDGQTAQPGGEPREQAVPAKAGSPSNAMTQRPPEMPTDIPAVDESMPPRSASVADRTPSDSNDPETRRTPGRSDPLPQSRTPSQSMPDQFFSPRTAEDEIKMVQDQIDKPTPEALMELFEDPATHIKDFIGVYGEDAVPDEIWSMLESPTGMPPEDYPYPEAPGMGPAFPPRAPMPPPGTYPANDVFGPPPDMLMPAKVPPRPMMNEPPLPPDLMSELGGRGY